MLERIVDVSGQVSAVRIGAEQVGATARARVQGVKVLPRFTVNEDGKLLVGGNVLPPKRTTKAQ